MSIINLWLRDGGFEITREMPFLSNYIELRAVEKPAIEIDLHLPLEQWHIVRKAFPKAGGYTMHMNGDRSIQDHPAADAYAEEFYVQQRAKLIPPEVKAEMLEGNFPAEPNAQDDTDEQADKENGELGTGPDRETDPVDDDELPPRPDDFSNLPSAPPPAPQMKPVSEADEEDMDPVDPPEGALPKPLPF